MKAIITTYLLLVCTFASAQNVLTRKYNALKPDSLNKEIISSFDVGGEGYNVIWDFSNMDFDDNTDTTSVRLYHIDNRFLWCDNGTMATFHQDTDTLFMSREETPIYETDFSSSVIKMIYPFYYGSVISAPFSGKGLYEGKIALTENGNSLIKGDAHGTLILAEGDTLRNVLRVHTILDSSIELSEVQSNGYIMTVKKITDIYEWYAQGYRYPVLESREVRMYYDKKLISRYISANRMSPCMQSDIMDPENEEIRNKNSRRSLISYDVNINGCSAVITYNLQEDANIGITLADSSGILYWRHEACMAAGEGYRTVVPLSGLHRGQYVIFFSVNGVVESCKVNVQ